ncbi:hypothetical protein [Pseudoxanthomonas japonensis]|uniref:hypothetical protein n=1 Tax=Pseudoxanthomonas japonensis TaxID=69284 RepID=UPI0037483D40
MKCGRWMIGMVLAACLGNAAAQTVRWEDYRGNDRVGTVYTGPAGAPTFANNTGTGAARLNALRAIAANPANAVRTGTVADINYRAAANNLCNMDTPATSVASCNVQAMGRVSYALIRFPAAGTYSVSIAHDDNVELGFSSDYANTAYRTASYDVPVGTVNDWTANEDTYVSLGTFTAANANSCALVRMYWLNHGGINHARLRWTLPGSGTPAIIPSTAFRDPAAAASANGCNGSITGNGTTITLNKVLGAPRADASDQFTVQIGTTSTTGTVREATTSGAGVGQQASTAALAVTTGTTYYLRDTMAAGSASTLAGAYTATIACTRNGTAFTPAGASPTWNVTPAANDQIVCAITNTARPILRLSKELPDGRLQAADQFALAIAGTGAGAGASVTTTGTTNAPTQVAIVSPATVGASYTFSETGAGGANLADYTTTYACTNARSGGSAPTGNGASFAFAPAAGDQLSCVFRNVRIPRTDLSITKAANPTTALSGSVVTYTVTANNPGPSAANGTVIRDTPGAGLNCTDPVATAACAASGGASCPGATVPVASLTGAGVTIPALPAGGQIVLTLQCRVTATGLTP